MRALLAAVVIAGCSSKPDIHTTADNVCDEVAAALCYDMSQCCGGDQLAQLLGLPAHPSDAACHAAVVQRCTAAMAPDRLSAAAGNVAFDGNAMDDCLTSMLLGDSCSAVGPPWAEACAQSPWVGLLTKDDICNTEHECGTGLSCVARTCQLLGQIGDPCLVQSDCRSDLTCDGRECTGRGEAGTMCANDGSCLSGRCMPGVCSTSGMGCYVECSYCMISKIPCSPTGCPANDFCTTEGCDGNACVPLVTDYCTGPIHALGLDHG